jgi:hypothetical protein
MDGFKVRREERLARTGTGDHDRRNVMSAIKSWTVRLGSARSWGRIAQVGNAAQWSKEEGISILLLCWKL